MRVVTYDYLIKVLRTMLSQLSVTDTVPEIEC